MNPNRHVSNPLKMKEEIEPGKVEAFTEAIDNSDVKTSALLLATSGLRKSEVLSLKKGYTDRNPKKHYSLPYGRNKTLANILP